MLPDKLKQYGLKEEGGGRQSPPEPKEPIRNAGSEVPPEPEEPKEPEEEV